MAVYHYTYLLNVQLGICIGGKQTGQSIWQAVAHGLTQLFHIFLTACFEPFGYTRFESCLKKHQILRNLLLVADPGFTAGSADRFR